MHNFLKTSFFPIAKHKSDRLSIGKDEVGRVSDTQVTVKARGHFISFHSKDYADIAS